MNRKEQEIAQLKKDWSENPRWNGVKRGYTAEDVVRLRGSVKIEHTLAKLGAEKLWKKCNEMPFVNSLGALTGNQAMQQVKAGVKAKSKFLITPGSERVFQTIKRDGIVDTGAMRPLARLGYMDYAVVGAESMFTLNRPTASADGQRAELQPGPWDGVYR